MTRALGLLVLSLAAACEPAGESGTEPVAEHSALAEPMDLVILHQKEIGERLKAHADCDSALSACLRLLAEGGASRMHPPDGAGGQALAPISTSLVKSLMDFTHRCPEQAARLNLALAETAGKRQIVE
ncbi:MAG: hypothetical protein JXR96_23200 [Deltaproteobacteria bacterium]|nr:hypothetical protein [Deltaproteobacteria bacterium]